MLSTSDVVVIGGGVIGTSAAMHLAQIGAGTVTLIEKGQLASGATGRSGAMIREHYLNPPLVHIAQEASTIFHSFKDVVGGDAGFVETGRILLFSETDRHAVEANVSMNRELGVNIHAISPESAKVLLPDAIMDDVAIAIWEPEAGYADPIATTESYAEQARIHGVQIMTNTPVTHIQSKGGRITGVATSEGIIQTNTVLNATGPWCNLIDSPTASPVPISPTRVHVIQLRRPRALESLKISVIDHVTGAWLREDVGGHTLVGSETQQDVHEIINPNQIDLTVNQNVISRYWERAAARFPAFLGTTCKGGYGATYDLTPDGNPVLDKSDSINGLYFAVGFSGHGFKLSPVIGRMMAQFITEGESLDFDIRPFRLSRFSEDDLIIPIHPYANRVHF